MVKSICFVTSIYPHAAKPASGAFVKQLVCTIARMGIECVVIHPVSVCDCVRQLCQSRKGRFGGNGDENVLVVRPVFLSLSNRTFGRFSSYAATHFFFRRAVFRALRRLSKKPDIVYGHFCSAGAVAAMWGARHDVPSVVALGESSLGHYGPVLSRLRGHLRHVNSVVAVSNALGRAAVNELQIPADRVAVFPNGVDANCFFPRGRAEMRNKYKLPHDVFIVAFVGHFNQRKGARRVAEAIEGLEGVGAVFVGDGPLLPTGSGVLFRGSLRHEEVPEMLSAADVFVLPTEAEGCCNAIIEAMACGLPIVTSIGEFNDGIVDENVSLRVKPEDIGAIRDAIVRLRDDGELRQEMAKASLERARGFDVEKRAARIVAWLSRESDWHVRG